VDTRPVAEVHRGTPRGALSIPAPGKAATHIGWAFDPETDDAEIVVLAADTRRAAEIRDHFVRVGVDGLTGYVTSFDGLEEVVPETVSPADLEELRASRLDSVLLDVRNRSEHAAGTVPGATQLSAGKVLFHRDQLPDPAEGGIIAFCQSGLRASVAAAALRRAGHEVVEIEGSYAGWERWHRETSVDH
jgi:hydroxyacylglutathione hydrolase